MHISFEVRRWSCYLCINLGLRAMQYRLSRVLIEENQPKLSSQTECEASLYFHTSIESPFGTTAIDSVSEYDPIRIKSAMTDISSSTKLSFSASRHKMCKLARKLYNILKSKSLELLNECLCAREIKNNC